MITLSKRTHYETLCIPPGSSTSEALYAYRNLVIGLLEDETFGSRTTMRCLQHIELIEQMTIAVKVLGKPEYKMKYDRDLERQGLICSLCNGTGKIRLQQPGSSPEWLGCAACSGTGWSFTVHGGSK